MFFWPKKKKEETDFHIGTMQKIKSALLALEGCYEDLTRQPAQKAVREICKSTDRILKELAADANHTHRLAMFADYYLPETAALARQYAKIKQNKLHTEQGDTLVAEMEAFFPAAAAAFAEILATLTLPEPRAVQGDMAVLIEELKRKGLAE